MLREREEEPVRARRSTEPVQQLDAKVAALLRMQQAAGNHAVSRLIAGGASRRGVVDRAVVESTVTETSQKHHPTYRFTFSGEHDAQVHDLDAWHTRKKHVGGPAFAATLNRQQILDVINGWDCTSSIVGLISDSLVGTSGWASATGVRLPKDSVTAVSHTVSDQVTQTQDGKVFAMHFLALKHNLDRRQADIVVDLPRSITIKKSKKVPKSTPKPVSYPLVWTNLLKAARMRLKPLLVNRTAPPEWQDEVKLVHQAYFAGEAGDANVEMLRTYGLVYDVGGKTAFSKKAGESNKTTGWQYEVTKIEPDIDVAFGVNHLAVLLYYEWRAVSEIMERAQAPAAQANAVPQQPPTVALPAATPAAAQPRQDAQQRVETEPEGDLLEVGK